ncbi:hypothetical protein MMMDOFMJ_0684 [Methylobacterium gnaphalii]|uniref:Uncharacterized protein n=1 Tax=Methylobacterium gnaphalii TaxID=1010610 RepID=A0A512JI79_9HYPH|nr:hypothetical protein MGN01_14890 [Methylobacterium gnaphalii]GJD67768.1 hypothetical protein MMMDOFMJ_0684 [Methylobacterium gnaphalii]GLS50063.1 hypothetical protein GCM10007885_29150 [Methylobacterium gnaphalii]
MLATSAVVMVMMVVVMTVPDAVHEGRVVRTRMTGTRRQGSGLYRSDLQTGSQDESGEAAEKPCGHPYPHMWVTARARGKIAPRCLKQSLRGKQRSLFADSA